MLCPVHVSLLLVPFLLCDLCISALRHLELPTAGHLFIMQGPLNWTKEFCLLINKTRGGYLAQIVNCPWVRGRNCHPPKLHRLLPLIAQRPVMARWNRDAESIYKLKETMRNYVIERSQAIEGQSLFDLFKQ